MNKTALVTGASSGIGAATVTRLLSDGYVVYAAARRLERMRSLATAGARLIALDLTNDASMVEAIAHIRAETGRLDVLVNNAGYGSLGALEDVPMEEARRQFEVNLFGAARLCQLALPMMRAQKFGKIVNVSSVGGKFGQPFGTWYHASKYALEGLSDCLRMELLPFGIDVIVIEPGAIKTEWGDIAHESMLKMSGHGAYADYAQRHAKMFERAATSSLPSPPETIANVIAQAIAAKRPKTRYAVAGGAKIFMLLRGLLSDRMLDGLIWRMSQGSKSRSAQRA